MPQTINIPSDHPVPINAESGKLLRVTNTGSGTIYHNDTLPVSSGVNDGSIAAAATSTFTGPQWLISSALGPVSLDYEPDVGLEGGIALERAPAGFYNWQPIAATSGTDTTPANGTQFVTSLFLPVNKTLTGVGYLIGSVGGTDRAYAVLYSASGAALANSTLASNGTVVGTAANAQTLAFTSTYEAKGPRLYYVGLSMNGTTARFRSVPAHSQAGIHAGQVAQTHATVAAITPPVTFTADKAPVVFVY